MEKVSREIFGEIFETSQLDELCDRATYLIDNPNEKEDQNIVKILKGAEVAPRKDFITEKALEVENLDI